MQTVTLRIDVPEEMEAEAICGMLDKLRDTLKALPTDDFDEQIKACDADWTSLENGDLHYWNP